MRLWTYEVIIDEEIQSYRLFDEHSKAMSAMRADSEELDADGVDFAVDFYDENGHTTLSYETDDGAISAVHVIRPLFVE